MVIPGRQSDELNSGPVPHHGLNLAQRTDAVIAAIDQCESVIDRRQDPRHVLLAGDEVKCSFVGVPNVVNAVGRYRRG